MIPNGRVVRDPVFRDLLSDDGIDPDTTWFPPVGAEPGEYTLDDLFRYSIGSGRRSLASWLPENKGTDRGTLEVDLVNSFVHDLFPLLSDPGAEWSYHLSYDQKLLHDLLDESLTIPEGLSEEETLAWLDMMLEEYRAEFGG